MTDTYRTERRARVDKARRDRLTLAKLRGEDTSLVEANPIRKHTHRLVEIGWPYAGIVSMAGFGTGEGLRLIAAGRHDHVRRQWSSVLAVPLSYRVPTAISDQAFVPAAGAIRRVRALLALGWTHEDLNEAAGRDLTCLAGPRQQHMRATLWRRIDALYEEMSARPGPSEATRSRCRTWGYLPPLAWDDIDDATETARPARARPEDVPDSAVVQRVLSGEWNLTATRADRVAVLAEWRAAGRSVAELGRLTGWKPERYYDTPSEVA